DVMRNANPDFRSARSRSRNDRSRCRNRRSLSRNGRSRSSEIRINPYLAFAGLIAAGLAGITENLELPGPCHGDAYRDRDLPDIPKTLRESIEVASNSAWLRDVLGDDVVKHYVHAARWEQLEYDRRITDWELGRGFERT
ncbi:hypothetical protein ACLFKU_41565, partial [Paraburkholderia sp. EG304]